MEPVLKWAGGKRKLLSSIKNYINREVIEGHTLYEPFIGGGSLSFDLEYPNTVINDFNQEITNVYEQIKNNPEQLIDLLRIHQVNHCDEYYYQIRNLDRSPIYQEMDLVSKAARVIYLNKTCYNGLYRVNSRGYYNVPVGRYVNPDIVMENRIRAMHEYLFNNDITILTGDFEQSLHDVQPGDFVYFDPPYDYETSGFTSYVMNGFSREDLTRLRNVCDQLIANGVHVLISNNDTQFVNDLFGFDHYHIEHIEASRFINCDGKKRNKVKEVLIYG